MLDLGRHAEFVWASYAIVTLVAVAIVGWLVLEGRRHARELTRLEARGVRRRSTGAATPAPVEHEADRQS